LFKIEKMSTKVISINASRSVIRDSENLKIDIFGGFLQLVPALKLAFEEKREIKSIYVYDSGADIRDDEDVTFLNERKHLIVTFGDDPIQPKKGTVEYLRHELRCILPFRNDKS